MARVSKIHLKQLPQTKVLSVRKTIDFMTEYADYMESAVVRIQALLREHQVLPGSGPIVCFHNTQLKTLDVEVFFAVSRSVEPAGDAAVRTLPEHKLSPLQLNGDPTRSRTPHWRR